MEHIVKTNAWLLIGETAPLANQKQQKKTHLPGEPFIYVLIEILHVLLDGLMKTYVQLAHPTFFESEDAFLSGCASEIARSVHQGFDANIDSDVDGGLKNTYI